MAAPGTARVDPGRVPVRRLGHAPALDGVRGIAIALILAYHAFPNRFPGAFVGVDVFFALSGFLITTLLIAEWDRWGNLSFWRFYARRVLRLYPALLGLLGGYLVVSWLVPDAAGGVRASSVVAVLTYRTNLFLAAGHPLSRMLEHSWSLAFEEQFYLCWPLVLSLALRFVRRPGAIMGMTAALAAASALARPLLYASGTGAGPLYFGPFTHADGVLLGCFVGEAYCWARPRLDGRAVRLGCVAFLAVGTVAFHTSDPLLYRAGLAAIAVASAGLVWTTANQSAVIGSLPARRRVWTAPPLLWLGRLSYSLYLWHYPWYVVAHDHVHLPTPLPQLLGLIAGLSCAVFSFYVIEQPFLRVKSRLRRAAPSPDAPASAPDEGGR